MKTFEKSRERGVEDKAKRHSREREVVCWVAEFVIAGGGGLRMEWRRTRAGGLQVIDSYSSGYRKFEFRTLAKKKKRKVLPRYRSTGEI